VNLSPLIGAVISSGKASLGELATVLSLEDMHDILEVIVIDAHNLRILDKRREAD
jgi:hypothetical protein